MISNAFITKFVKQILVGKSCTCNYLYQNIYYLSLHVPGKLFKFHLNFQLIHCMSPILWNVTKLKFKTKTIPWLFLGQSYQRSLYQHWKFSSCHTTFVDPDLLYFFFLEGGGFREIFVCLFSSTFYINLA